MFSHIYVEDAVYNTARCNEILSKFPDSEIIRIKHYKDVFNRRRQSYRAQHRDPALILARKDGQLVYPGSPNCQDFGNDAFYYTSCMMNCVFDCEYCYLKGMYPTGNLVLFLNLEDIFAEVTELCKDRPIYLCVSYDTDLLSIEPVAGYVEKWIRFTERTPNLTIEVRTKGANTKLYQGSAGSVCDRVIFAYTLSPESIIRKYEHRTASLKRRLEAAKSGIEAGVPVRLCFDPMLYCPDWKAEYRSLVEETFAAVPAEKVRDISIGSFRIAPDYLKTIRKAEPDSAVVQYPFVTENGVCSYGSALSEEMEGYLVSLLMQYVEEDKLFRWEEEIS